MGNVNIPQDFNKNIYNILDGFNNLLFFRWDLAADTLHWSTASNQINLSSCTATSAYDFFFTSNYIYPSDLFIFVDFWDHIHAKPPQDGSNYLQDFLELRLKQDSNEKYLWSDVNLLIFYDKDTPRAIFGSIRNVNEKKEHQLALLHEAEHDALTGLLNKKASERYISHYLENLPDKETDPALLIMDADGFKKINDTFGHLFGDAVLTDMAMALEKHFDQADIISRMGGDEFLVLVKRFSSLENLKEKCQKLVDSLHRTYRDDDKEVPFSISIGIALYPEHGKTYKELFRHADRALYSAKASGKNNYYIYRAGLFQQDAAISERTPEYDADLQQRAFKDDMIEFIFRLFYETKNPAATIDLSLSLLGKQFNLDRVAVSTYTKSVNSYNNVFEWLSPHGSSIKAKECDSSVADIMETHNNYIFSRYKATPYGVLSLCEDTQQLDSATAEAFSKLGIRSFAYCKITRGSEDLGSVCFETSTQPHTFSEEELSYLNIFSELLGNVLLIQDNDEALMRQNKRLIDIIDHMQELICVIDKDTYELLFFNNSIRQALPETSSVQSCYHRFHQFTEPCKDCPVKDLSDNGAEYIMRTVCGWGLPATTKAFNISWEKGRNTALVIMEPF